MSVLIALIFSQILLAGELPQAPPFGITSPTKVCDTTERGTPEQIAKIRAIKRAYGCHGY
jgi:hypothetical protein